ncbi:MAG: phenylalanine--tRNA ligase subunit alpha [bacterium]|nr:phenylalanine--tRNA ligase subunit alpha [bacterium]MDZ4284626.1 phenylalanine--tRNA ligase subunit alpha [Patescibacteria group bacterium]
MKNQEKSSPLESLTINFRPGHLHPLTQVMERIAAVFTALGFAIADGPEIETEYYNFDALNIPADHPARDMQDTFWLAEPKSEFPISKNQFPNTTNVERADAGATSQKLLLRTHISSLQVRYMEAHGPPFRMISSGRVYRHEATDATHEAQYHYTEGLAVEQSASLAQLKYVLDAFAKSIFGESMKSRFRPAYFPFVEPGVEVDLSCVACGGVGGACSVCKGTGWVEVLGAGMVHPQVLTNGGIDPALWRGYAFGVGVDRIAMLLYGIPDIRLFYNGDLRVVNQF